THVECTEWWDATEHRLDLAPGGVVPRHPQVTGAHVLEDRRGRAGAPEAGADEDVGVEDDEGHEDRAVGGAHGVGSRYSEDRGAGAACGCVDWAACSASRSRSSTPWIMSARCSAAPISGHRSMGWKPYQPNCE